MIESVLIHKEKVKSLLNSGKWGIALSYCNDVLVQLPQESEDYVAMLLVRALVYSTHVTDESEKTTDKLLLFDVNLALKIALDKKYQRIEAWCYVILGVLASGVEKQLEESSRFFNLALHLMKENGTSLEYNTVLLKMAGAFRIHGKYAGAETLLAMRFADNNDRMFNIAINIELAQISLDKKDFEHAREKVLIARGFAQESPVLNHELGICEYILSQIYLNCSAHVLQNAKNIFIQEGDIFMLNEIEKNNYQFHFYNI